MTARGRGGGGNRGDKEVDSPANTTTGHPPLGADTAKHAAAQQAAQRADAISKGFLPSCMAAACGLNGTFSPESFRGFVDQFLRDAGDPQDPIERVLVRQLVFADLRLSSLHAEAAEAKSAEVAKIYTAAAARLLAEIRRVAITIRDYRERTPRTEKIRLSKVS